MRSIRFDITQYPNINRAEMETWCTDQFGLGGVAELGSFNRYLDKWSWVCCSVLGYIVFYFKEEKHYNWFVLRWA
jgi:hypothetical protein